MIIQQFVQNLFRHLCTRLCHREMYSLSWWLFIQSQKFLTKDLSERAMSNPLVLCLCFFFFSLSSLVKIQLPVGARISSAGLFWENHILLKIFVYDSTQRKKYGWILGCFVFKSTEGLFSEISLPLKLSTLTMSIWHFALSFLFTDWQRWSLSCLQFPNAVNYVLSLEFAQITVLRILYLTFIKIYG